MSRSHHVKKAGASTNVVLESRFYAPGTWIWIPDKDVVWRKAEVLESRPGERLKIRSEDFGTEIDLPCDVPTHLCNLEMFTSDGLFGLDDLTHLTHLHEPAVLNSLHLRFTSDKIYTFTGPILIAVNPFKSIEGLYSLETVKSFLNTHGDTASVQLPPHVFAIGAAAYRGLCESKASQTILISGESGAGKTESTKFVMKFLALAGSEDWNNRSQIENQVLQSNPLLETLGNAKTLRNDNSSRFGKFIEMQFNLLPKPGQEALIGRLVGARIHTYLLETVRVCHQLEGERNYHSFYQICAAAGAAASASNGVYHFPSLITDVAPEAKACDFDLSKLASYEHFRYLTQSSCSKLTRVDDVKEFEFTIHAMQTIGISVEEQKSLIDLIGAVLYLGNVQFECSPGNSESSQVTPASQEAFSVAATLLQVEERLLADALTTRTITVEGKELRIPFKLRAAEENRDSLAKALYGTAFLKIVKRTNESIGYRDDVNLFCGVLDIFGFECFEFNSFEQLCINFTNERLQQFFNTFVFKCEEQLYTAEGIPWNPLDFPDNQDCVDLMEQKNTGLFAMLDEECMVPNGSDQSLCNKMREKHRDNPRFGFIKTRSEWFIVNHFAGPVNYCVQGFLDKNRDQLSMDAQKCIIRSRSSFVRDLFQCVVTARKTVRHEDTKKRLVTVSYEFRNQLDHLMGSIGKTEPHFIRCIKPNHNNVPDEFNRSAVTEQLRYGGVLQAVQVSRAGYPVRLLHHNALLEYRVLCDKDVLENQLGAIQDTRQKVQAMLEHLDAKYSFRKPAHAEYSWAVGKTLVFLKHESYEILSSARAQRRNAASIVIQSRWKGLCQRHYFKHCKASTVLIQSYVRGMIARRLAQRRRKEKAASLLQGLARRVLARQHYHDVREKVLRLQCAIRQRRARDVLARLRRERAAVRIQTAWRCYHHRSSYQRLVRGTRKAQLRWKQIQAKRELRRLRAEQRDSLALRGLVKTLQDELRGIKERLQLSEEERRRLEAQVSPEKMESLQRERNALQQQLDEAMASHATARSEVMSLTTSNNAMKQELQNVTAMRQAVEARLEEATQAYTEAQRQLIDLQQRNAALEGQLHEKQSALDSVLQELTALKEKSAQTSRPTLVAHTHRLTHFPPQESDLKDTCSSPKTDVVATRTPSPTATHPEAVSPDDLNAAESCTRNQLPPSSSSESSSSSSPLPPPPFPLSPPEIPCHHVDQTEIQQLQARIRELEAQLATRHDDVVSPPGTDMGRQPFLKRETQPSLQQQPKAVLSRQVLLSHHSVSRDDLDVLILGAPSAVALVSEELRALTSSTPPERLTGTPYAPLDGTTTGDSLPSAVFLYCLDVQGTSLSIGTLKDETSVSRESVLNWAARSRFILIVYDMAESQSYRSAYTYMKMARLENGDDDDAAANAADIAAYAARSNCPLIEGTSLQPALTTIAKEVFSGVVPPPSGQKPSPLQHTAKLSTTMNNGFATMMSRLQNYFGAPDRLKKHDTGPILFPSFPLKPVEPSSIPSSDPSTAEGALVLVDQLPESASAVTCLAFGGEFLHRRFYLLAAACKDGSVTVYRVPRTAWERQVFDQCVDVPHHNHGDDAMSTYPRHRGSSHVDATPSTPPATTTTTRQDIDVYLQLFGHSRAITQLLFSHDESQLVTASVDKSVRFWSMDTGDMLKVFTDSAFCVCAAFLPINPAIFLISNANSVLRVVNSTDGTVVQRLRPESEIRALTFDETGLNCIAGSRTGLLHVLETHEDGCLDFKLKHKISKAAITCISYVAPSSHEKQPYVLVNACDSTIFVVDCIYGPPTGCLTGLVIQQRLKVAHSFLPLRSCYSNAGGGWVISASEDCLVYIYSLAADAGYKNVLLRRHQAPVVTVAVNQANTILATADSCGKLMLWRWGSYNPPKALPQ